MSDSNGRYIGDTDGSARTWRDDETLGGWNAEENKGTQSAQLQKYTVSIPQAELDALRARIRELSMALTAVIELRDYASNLTLTMHREYRTVQTEDETAEYKRLLDVRDAALAAALAAGEEEE